jgi:hypothetical protein
MDIFTMAVDTNMTLFPNSKLLPIGAIQDINITFSDLFSAAEYLIPAMLAEEKS